MAIDFKQLDKARDDRTNSRSLGSLDGILKKSTKDNSVSTLFAKKLKSADRMFFTEQLALLLETGNGLVQSLHILSEQAENPLMCHLIDRVIDDVNSGKPLSQALRSHPELFSSTYTNLVAVSENGGFMPQVLAELLEMDEKREKLNVTLRSALSYPVFLLSFSFAVVIFVLVVVFPKFSKMFASIADELPASTKILMAFSEQLTDYWAIYIAATVGILLILWRWLCSTSGKASVDALKLKIPILKTIFTELYMVQSMRVMGLSLGNSVSVMDTLMSCREVVDNQVFQQFVLSLEADVQDGKGISQGFKKSKLIPNIVSQMVATGEESGSLPKVMSRLASYYERQLDKRLVAVSKAAEPVMLLVMGVVVGLLVSSLILPIFKLSRAVG